MVAASIEEAKAQLYGEALDTFVSERNDLVKAIRAAGDKALANEVKALRKPSAVAAEVNAVVRADPAGVELILQAAELLRSAQTEAIGGGAIDAVALQQQYRAAIKALAETAPTRPAEVRAALEAATIHEASNEDLRTGCLVAVPVPVSIFGVAPSSAREAEPELALFPAEDASDEPVGEAVDELEQRRAKRREAAEEKESAKKADEAKAEQEAEAERKADEAKAEQEAEAERKAAEAKAEQEAEAERKAAEAKAKQAEKKAAAKRKEQDKARRAELKDLKKAHREAVRAHLAALDAEEEAATATEAAETALQELDREQEELETALAALDQRRSTALDERDESAQRERAIRTQAEEAEATVEELASAIEDLEAATP